MNGFLESKQRRSLRTVVVRIPPWSISGSRGNRGEQKQMITEVTVLTESAEEYDGKKGRVKMQRVSVLDMDGKCRFKNTFDYDLSDDERDKYTGKLLGKRLTLGVSDFVVFGGRLRARGQILAVHGDNGSLKADGVAGPAKP